MFLTRIAFSTLLAAAGFALVVGTAPVKARQPAKDEAPRAPSVTDLVSYKSQGIPKADLKKAKDAMTAYAKYNVDYVGHPRVHTAPQEFNPAKWKDGTPVKSVDDLITDVNRFILVPVPGGQVGEKDADYIRELGAVLDATFKDPIENHGERVVRVNMARMYASVCRSGAQAHYATVTELLKNANTPPEVKYYALQAAGNLLAAYDVFDFRSRKHSHDGKVVGDLIAAIADVVLKPGAILPAAAVPGAKLVNIPEDQLQVYGFIRRQAVKALGQVRFADKVPGGPDQYPSFILARVAMSDPALVPPPSPGEIADAIMGICNMAPPRAPPGAGEPYAYAMSDAVLTGILSFAAPRGANPEDKSLPWRGYSAKLGDSLKTWRPLFDANFDPARPTSFAAEFVPPILAAVGGEADKRVLSAIEKGGASTVDIPGLRAYRDNTLRGDKKWTLAPFKDKPQMVLPKK